MLSYDPTTEVPIHFSRVDQVTFDKVFMPDRHLVSEHFGDLFVQNHFHDTPGLSHAQLSMWLGGLAMYGMLDTSHRYWTEEDKVDHLDAWSHLVWRVIHVLPLGYAFATHQFNRAESPSWNPAIAPYKKGVSAKASNRSLAGGPIGLSIFMKLFPEYFSSTGKGMMAFAICDIFSSSPNTDNPLYVALRTAARTSLKVHPYPIPFFWEDALKAVLSPSPTDVYAITASTSFKSVESYNLQNVLQDTHVKTADKKTTSANAVAKVNPYQYESQAPKTPQYSSETPLFGVDPTPAASDTPPAVTDMSAAVQPEPPASIEPAARATSTQNSPLEQRQASSTQISQPEVSDIKASEEIVQGAPLQRDRSVISFVDDMATTFNDKYADCTFLFNQPNAVCHYIQGDVYFVTPLAYTKFLEVVPMSFDVNGLEQWLLSQHVVTPVKAQLVNKKGKKFNVQLARIDSEFAHLFIPNNIEPMSNGAFTILESVR